MRLRLGVMHLTAAALLTTSCALIPGTEQVTPVDWPREAKFELDDQFETQFEFLVLPGRSKIKEEGLMREFPYLSFDEAWDATLVVLAQKGIVVRVSKQTGVIVAVEELPWVDDRSRLHQIRSPLTLLVEAGDPVAVHAYWMDELDREVCSFPGPGGETGHPAIFGAEEADTPGERALKEQVVNALFADMAVQAYADRKWQYLTSGASAEPE